MNFKLHALQNMNYISYIPCVTYATFCEVHYEIAEKRLTLSINLLLPKMTHFFIPLI